MSIKKLLSGILSSVMLFTCMGISPVITNAEEEFVNSDEKYIDTADTAPEDNMPENEPITGNKESDEDYTAYLFAYFTSQQEKLYYGVSRDGYKFRALNEGNPVFTSTEGSGHLRDPYIFRGEDNYLYIVVTDMRTDIPDAWGQSQHTIAIYKTKDLINMEQSILIDYQDFDGFSECDHAWAPQIVWCGDHDNGDGTTGAYMIYLALKPKAGEALEMYHQFTTDLFDISKYTTPEKMLTGEENPDAEGGVNASIDGDIVFNPYANDNAGEYIMYYNGDAVAVCDTIDGVFERKSYKGESGITDNQPIEGSNIFKLNDEDKWIYCADGNAFKTGFHVYETTDFETYTRVEPKSDSNPNGYDYDFVPRHGYVVPITESELETLMLEYGYVDLESGSSDNMIADMTLPYTAEGYKITGNITLPETYNGVDIMWTSSNEDIISTVSEVISDKGDHYTKIPAGVVNRPSEDTKVVLTAAAADNAASTKKFFVTVKAAPEKNYAEMEEDGDFKGYLYASFIEPKVSQYYQQIYFASSDDGLNWDDLNNSNPVLQSNMGTGGLRDPYLVRSPEGDKFYLLATDLDCTSGDWDSFAKRGSKYLMVWESDDLVNWSEQRMVKVADDNIGCAWAPEAIYDDITGEYIVYWSGTDIDENSETYGNKIVYYSKTRDFYSFTDPKPFVEPIGSDGTEDGTSRSFIDTTMIKGDDNKFYRVTKYEDVSPTRVFMDVADTPSGEYTRVQTNLGDNEFLGTEGPGWFKFNKDDQTADKKYCLMLDGYNGPNSGTGFFPNTISGLTYNDGDTLNFERVTENFRMRSFAKHGGILPLTQDEYDRVNRAYGVNGFPERLSDDKPFAVSSYDFEKESLSDITAVFKGGASLIDDEEKGSRVLYLDGSAGSYMEFPAPKDSEGNPLESYTVSFDVKNNTTGNYFNFYIGDGSSNTTGVNYFGVKIGDDVLLSSKNRTNKGGVELKKSYSISGVQGNWTHCDIVVADSRAQIYIDNVPQESLIIFPMKESEADVIRFGFSAWSADSASNAYYDNIRVYPAALSADGLKSEDLPAYFTEENICFNSDDYWVAIDDTSKLSQTAGWTSEQMPTFDGDTIHYIGIYPGKPVTMGEGYGKDSDWVAMQFNLTNWAHGDYAVYDIDGNIIFADCYANDGYWIGHGERSFGGTVRDNYGINRLPSYLKTEISEGSALSNTGKIEYGQDTECTILAENQSGRVTDSYTGDYYTVKVFKDMKLVSTEYYKGHINGIKTLENLKTNKDRNCFGDLKIYASGGDVQKPEPTDNPDISEPGDNIDTRHMLYGVNFNNQNTEAYKGKTIENGSFSYEKVSDNNYAAVFNGTDSYLSLKNDDGGNLLAGKDNIIITMRAKPEKGSTNGWYFYTSWNSNPQGNGSNNKRSYVGIFDNGTTITGERFRDSNSDPTIVTPTKLNQWQEITYVISGNRSEMYIDGKFCGEQTYAVTLSTLLGNDSDQVAYVGKANWADGEYFKGAIDGIEIYDFSPNMSIDNINHIKGDIMLPGATAENDGYTITWSSSDTGTISNDGKVTRPDSGKKDVTLTATVEFGGHKLTRDFKATVLGMDYVDFRLDISSERDVDIQPNMYGLFFEDINYAADGGLYAEMVENRAFEEIMHNNKDEGSGSAWNDPGYAWSAVNGTMDYSKTENPLHENNKHYLHFTGTSFKNKAYDGMYIEKNKKYNISLYARKGDYTGGITVKTVKDGNVGFNIKLTDDNMVASEFSKNGWVKYEAQATAADTVRYSDFIIELDENAEVDFDLISVIPDDAVVKDSSGKGIFRRDLAEKLKALNPGFMRFPGGCIIEGWDLDNAYNWKDTVGSIEERKQNWNRWATTNPYNSYNQTYGLGYYEFFLLCEYLDCEPLPVQNAGMACQYQGGKRGGEAVPVYKDGTTEYTEEFYQYIQDTLDLIEFANGVDENNEWVKKRIDMGHPEPFNLTMIGIGNEQWDYGGQDGYNDWYTRYEAFEKEIHEKYPDIKLIGTSGPSAEGSSFDSAWNWIRENQEKNSDFVYAVDEHYYMSPQWFLDNDHRYDNYDRSAKVFAGEYAAHTTRTNIPEMRNNLESAIAEAAFMTGLERNADVVYMASYAPLFARLGYTQWHPDMIWFDDASSYGTPTYWVQSMYSNNNGTYTLKNSVNAPDEKAYITTSYDAVTGDVIVKIANPYDYEQNISLAVDDGFRLTGKADCEILTGDSLDAVNSIENPDNVKPYKSEIDVESEMEYEIPSYSFVIIRIHTINDDIISMTKCDVENGVLAVNLIKRGDLSDADIYIAVYDESGSLEGVVKNETEAKFEVDQEKNYNVKVMVWEKDNMKPILNEPIFASTSDRPQYMLMSYTTDGNEYYGGGRWTGETSKAIGNSLHLAVSDDGGKTYEPLNYNVGVLFAEADYTAEGGNPLAGVSKMFRSPYVFRLKDGRFGVITARADENSETDLTDGDVMLYTSDDLTSYNFEGYITLDTSAVYDVMCVYENGEYTISWSESKGGSRREVTTSDFKTLGNVKDSDSEFNRPKHVSNIANLTETVNTIGITKSEYTKLITELNAPVNTGVKKIEDITVSNGDSVELPETATALYNDGSEQEYPVIWDTSGLDLTKPGEYEVKGTIEAKDYDSGFIYERADPCMLKMGGKYYFVATRDNGSQTVLNIRVADTIEEIASAQDHELLAGGTRDLIWAPEIHNVNGKLMILFAFGQGGFNDVHSCVKVLDENGDPTKAEDWSETMDIMKKDGQSRLIPSGSGNEKDKGITLDMTCFEWNGKWYYSWSQRILDDPVYGSESANIYIAEFDPANPEKITSDTAVISRPVFAWERSRAQVDEGPFAIKNDGRLYMTVATNGTDWSYAIKLLTLKENGDPMEPKDWITKGYPLLDTAMNTSEPGPGHSSFTIDENGNPVLVYHWGKSGSRRTTSVKNVHFNTKGEPVLNIPRGEQIKDEYKNVSVRVSVTN